MKPDASFDNTRWKLVKLATLAELPVLQKDVFVTFTKDNNSFSGNAGCNNMHGTYSVTGNTLMLANAAVTRMMCPEENMKVENDFLKILGSSLSYQVIGDHMIWKQGVKIVAEFDAIYLR